MPRNQITTIVVLLSFAPVASAAVINVPGDQPTILAAVTAAVDGDVIILADGVYTGPDNRNVTVALKDLTIHSASNDPNLCTIDCESMGNAFTLSFGLTNATVISGLRIINGTGGLSSGGALEIAGGQPTVRNCIFEDNTASLGGAVSIALGDPTITECIFRNNLATSSGGAIVTADSNASFDRCLFVSNSATTGGAASLAGADQFRHCRFLGNVATGLSTGGAVWTTEAPFFINCEFSGNTADTGAGIYTTAGATVLQCTFSANVSSAGAGAIYFSGTGAQDLLVANTIIWINPPLGIAAPATFGTTLVRNTIVVITDVLSSPDPLSCATCSMDDPLFVDADGADNIPGTEDDDLRLLAGSPAIDAGANFFADALESDLIDNVRVVGVAVDLGVYEFGSDPPPPDCPADFTGPGDLPDGMVGILDFLKVLADWGACP